MVNPVVQKRALAGALLGLCVGACGEARQSGSDVHSGGAGASEASGGGGAVDLGSAGEGGNDTGPMPDVQGGAGGGGSSTDGGAGNSINPEDVGPYNILVIVADDYGVMDVGAYNPDTFYETPGLDRLAAEGARFSQGYVVNPVCSPTRFSIMTGKYPSRADATDWFGAGRVATFRPATMNHFMGPEEVTIAEALKANGYRTAFLGKWHLGPDETVHWPEQQGFDENVGGHRRGSPPGGYFSPYNNPRMVDGPDGEHLPERLTNDALGFMDQFKDDKFLIFLSFYSVHTPLQGKQDLIAKYEAKAASLPAGSSFADEEQVWPIADARRVRIKQEHPVYAAMVESMDTNINRLLDGLQEKGLADKTAVFFISDNGGLSTAAAPTSNLPYRGGKGWVYEGGIREPYMIKVPGVTVPGMVVSTPVISTDFYPTIMALTHTPPNPQQHQDGVDLWPLLSGSGALAERELFWHYPHYSPQGGFPAGAIRAGDFKLLERYEDGSVLLFDLGTDEGERNDLAQAKPEVVDMMRQKLHAWYKDVDAKFLRQKDGGPLPWSPP